MEIITLADREAFVFAGKSTFTLQSKVSGAHFTYQVRSSKDGSVYFVKAEGTGYIGIIPNGGAFQVTAKSLLPETHPESLQTGLGPECTKKAAA